MESIISYKERGAWGDSNYRGNCSGYVIKDLIENFYPKDKPKKFIEVFSGGGTGKDVCKELGISNSLHLDLNNGWNALIDEIPSGSDFTFSHPPYWDIVRYEWQRKEYHADDLSNVMDYQDFITKLDKVNEKIYHNLMNGGRHAILVGDIRKKGKYYSIIKDMSWFGDIESHIIKEQFNTVSSRKTYANSNFIPIAHEHLLIFKKNSIWQVPIKFTKDFVKSIKEMINVTWKNLIQATIEHLGSADIDSIYEILKNSKKAENNNNVRAKIRQTLNTNNCFIKKSNVWQLNF